MGANGIKIRLQIQLPVSTNQLLTRSIGEALSKNHVCLLPSIAPFD
jgi:hypothetical protein